MDDNPLPATPLTLDGSYILHQMFRVRWPAWKALGASVQKYILGNAEKLFTPMEQSQQEATGLFTLLGHKGDFMLLHFRPTLEALNQAELSIARAELYEYLEPTTSYVSVVELGLYEASVKLFRDLTVKGLRPGSGEWNAEVEAELAKQRQNAAARLWPELPQRRYLCFYPMSKYRGEQKNWYRESITDRQRMMRDHGMIGRQYAGRVTQIISGSIGFDDWEWGVDLFADDPLVFKKLVYEMRFDEASAVYGLFGAFFIGARFRSTDLGVFLDGKVPGFSGSSG